MCSLVQAMLAKTISSICHKGHFVVKPLLSANDHHTPRANTRVKCVLLSILSKHWGFEVAGHILYFRSAVIVSSSINYTDIIELHAGVKLLICSIFSAAS